MREEEWKGVEDGSLNVRNGGGRERRKNGRAAGICDGRTADDRAGARMDVFRNSYATFRDFAGWIL